MKIIKLTESDLEKIVKRVLVEQTKKNLPAATLTPSQPQQSSLQPTMNTKSGMSSLIKLPQKYGCMTHDNSAAVQYAISNGIDPFFVKYGLGVLGRESDWGESLKFSLKGKPEYIMNKMSEIIPGFKSVLQWGAKKVFNKDNWVPSMGVAQMTPDVAEKYGINLENLMSISGSLVAASKYLIDLYNQAKTVYDTNQPSKIIFNKQLEINPSSTGNAALDVAIMSYNAGFDKFKTPFCKTDNLQYMGPCNSPNGIYQPYPKENPNIKLKVDKNQVIKNYVPTLKTNTTGPIQKVVNKFSNTPQTQYITNTGYLKEVVETVKKFNCIK